MQTVPLTTDQRQRYHDIICSGQQALRRWSLSNPMRPVIERQTEDARRVLGIA